MALSGLGATPARAPTGLCIPILMPCGSTPPKPTPPPAPSPAAPTPPKPGSPARPTPGGGTTNPTPGPTTAPAPAAPDRPAPTFTLPAAQLTGSSISFSGLQSVSLVTVPLADGSTAPVLKLAADEITIDDFHLTVRKSTGPMLVTDSGRMELHGHVQVYVDSVTATLLNGSPLTLGASTPPPDGLLPPALLRVDLGLVGVTADSISLIPSHQQLK
ncbi:hypothetical protein [Leifsonia poae]|uniref:hypothetical protein n=1 Tax=Leifsonia poae TaxID=110933 RepID=UPI001CBA7F91|nr:hypothetical protein [Leifsonia poae]